MKNSKFLFDTNILAFSQNKRHPYHHKALKLHDLVDKGIIEGFIAAQNLFELFAVLTASPLVEKKIRSN